MQQATSSIIPGCASNNSMGGLGSVSRKGGGFVMIKMMTIFGVVLGGPSSNWVGGFNHYLHGAMT